MITNADPTDWLLRCLSATRLSQSIFLIRTLFGPFVAQNYYWSLSKLNVMANHWWYHQRFDGVIWIRWYRQAQPMTSTHQDISWTREDSNMRNYRSQQLSYRLFQTNTTRVLLSLLSLFTILFELYSFTSSDCYFLSVDLAAIHISDGFVCVFSLLKFNESWSSAQLRVVSIHWQVDALNWTIRFENLEYMRLVYILC